MSSTSVNRNSLIQTSPLSGVAVPLPIGFSTPIAIKVTRVKVGFPKTPKVAPIGPFLTGIIIFKFDESRPCFIAVNSSNRILISFDEFHPGKIGVRYS